jgi:two-component system nitrogen regulation sensor histidine kinase NtrY
VNVAPPPGSLRPEPPPEPPPATEVSRARSVLGRIANILLGKTVTLVLAALAFAVGLATFFFLARGAPFVLRPGVGVGLVLANLSAVLLLVAVLAGRLTRVWVERRRGSAGARLHVRLVLLFGGVAVAPAILVACFAVAFFHFGIQAWFNDPIRDAVTESLQVSHGYLDEHRDKIRAVALEMANDLTRARRVPECRSVGVR